MSITINTTVDIDAPKQLAWDVLTDFAVYHDWNPYMTIEGTAQVGAKLTVHMGMVFKPTVLTATPGLELRWVGRLGFRGIVDGEHFFILGDNADGTTRLTNGERFSGAIVALTKPFMNKEKNQAGFENFNRAFKQRVESLNT